MKINLGHLYYMLILSYYYSNGKFYITLLQEPAISDNKLMNLIMPLTIKLITCNTKGCRSSYDVLINTKQIPSSQAKWRRDLTINLNFKFIYDIPFSCT